MNRAEVELIVFSSVDHNLNGNCPALIGYSTFLMLSTAQSALHYKLHSPIHTKVFLLHTQ